MGHLTGTRLCGRSLNMPRLLRRAAQHGAGRRAAGVHRRRHLEGFRPRFRHAGGKKRRSDNLQAVAERFKDAGGSRHVS